MMNTKGSKQLSRQRRARKLREKNKRQANQFDRDARLVIVVNRSNQHTSVQAFDFRNHESKVVAQASTKDKEFNVSGTKVKKALAVGVSLGKKIKASLGDVKVIFDRNGYPYHGRVKAVAEGIRESDIDF